MTAIELLSQGVGAATERLGVRRTGALLEGWAGQSGGCKVVLPSGEPAWVKVRYCEPARLIPVLWDGEIMAPAVRAVPKPAFYDSCRWHSGIHCWQAILLQYVEDAPSGALTLGSGEALSHLWLRDLRAALEALASIPTDRLAWRTLRAAALLREQHGIDLERYIEHSITMHGDLHWGNLVRPRLTILDWEGWGLGPRGLDAALLLAYSMSDPGAAQAIRGCFADELATRQGAACRLYAATEVRQVMLANEASDPPPNALDGMIAEALRDISAQSSYDCRRPRALET